VPPVFEDDVAWETISGYLETLRTLSPRAFLLENVPGMAYKVHRDALDFIIDAAEDAGYECSWQIVNAANYGVPQMRERFMLVGTRDGAFEFPAPTHAKAGGEGVASTRSPWRTAGEVLSDLDTDQNADDVGHFAGGQHHDLLRQATTTFTSPRSVVTPNHGFSGARGTGHSC
jgi:DNA (cytosine-5)-methyltransferase 1